MLLLAVGAITGALLAAVGLLPSGEKEGAALPPGVVAQVNGRAIGKEAYERLVAAMEADQRGAVGAAERRHLLDRLIDEELLVQRGVELGLTASDRKVRADLTGGVIASVISEYEDAQPSEDELRAFYEQQRNFFTLPPRLRVRQVFVRVPGEGGAAAALQRARAAARRLRVGEEFAAVRAQLGDEEIVVLPDSLLPPAKVRDYIGPTALRAVLALAAGEVSNPVRSSLGYHVLQMVEREPSRSPAFGEIREQVLSEFRRRAGEKALRQYLQRLRTRAEIAVAPEFR